MCFLKQRMLISQGKAGTIEKPGRWVTRYKEFKVQRGDLRFKWGRHRGSTKVPMNEVLRAEREELKTGTSLGFHVFKTKTSPKLKRVLVSVKLIEGTDQNGHDVERWLFMKVV